MHPVFIWHNPRCSKSRETLALIQAQGITPDVILYLQTPPDTATLQRLLRQLGMQDARQLMRQKEPLYRALNLGEASLSQAALLAAMAAHPQLIERPVVVCNDQARLGRPPEQVLEILQA
ncbi:arsenate reductase (glutaredoxin) [Pantoea sp. 1.19]|uniref:arsenate reductase (glutaredoxin) n=1 Tax=Pantoea sp. 1.19 TaxID=1925589 RepID=UPI000948BEA4|nr:arsenate reductase (glutaredoxin) [Pantoea sp. 1.19]